MTISPCLRPRRARLLLAAAALLGLAGCYETQVPIVTQQNAHPTPIVEDGRYCEMAFDGTGGPAIDAAACVTLAWTPEARGWRTDEARIEADESGVSIRARRLGEGDDPVGRSGFFMVQAGPQPRRAAVGGRAVPLATAGLAVILPRQDMFAVVVPRLPQEEAIARARDLQVGLSIGERGPTIVSVGALASGAADLVGDWLAREAAREIHAAPQPGAAPQRDAIRIFVRVEGGDAGGPEALAARARAMLDALVFEAGVLNVALGLGLPPALIDPARSSAGPSPAPPAQEQADQRQATYEQVQRCLGYAAGVRAAATELSALLTAALSRIAPRGDGSNVRQIEEIIAGLNGFASNRAVEEVFATLAGQLEQAGVDRAEGARAFAAGLAEMALPAGQDLAGALGTLRAHNERIGSECR